MNKQPILPRSVVHEPLAHDSATKHVAGRAEYIDDMAEPAGTLHAYLALSERAHAEIVSIDLDADERDFYEALRQNAQERVARAEGAQVRMQVLQQVPLFRGLSREELERVDEFARYLDRRLRLTRSKPTNRLPNSEAASSRG